MHGALRFGYALSVWVRDYHRSGGGLTPWPTLIGQLHTVPLAAVLPDLADRIPALIHTELSRDPETDDVIGESQIFALIERMLSTSIPWYGGVLSVTNTALTGWSPEAHFLVDGEGESRVQTTTEAILSALSLLPTHVGVLEGLFVEIRTARKTGSVSIGGMEAVLDAVIAVTQCRAGWQRTLLAAVMWMHEACRVPLPEQRREAMADWLAQTCLSGFAPEAVTRAEILTALARSMSRRVR